MKKIYTIVVLIVIQFTLQAQFGPQQCIGGSGDDIIMDIVTTNDSGLLVIVETTSANGDFFDNHGGRDIGLIKLDKYRQIAWKKSIGDSTDNFFYCVKNSGNFSMISCGDKKSNSSLKLITCIDNDGNIHWEYKTYIRTKGLDTTIILPYYAKNDVLYDDGSSTIQTQLDSTIRFTHINPGGGVDWNNVYDYAAFFNNNTCPDINLQIRYFKFISFPLKNKKLLVFSSVAWSCATPGPTLNNAVYQESLLDANGNLLHTKTISDYSNFVDNIYTATAENDSTIEFIKIRYSNIPNSLIERVIYNYNNLEIVQHNDLIGEPVDLNNYYNNSTPLIPDYNHIYFDDSTLLTAYQSGDNHFVLYKLKKNGDVVWSTIIDSIVYFYNLIPTGSGYVLVYKLNSPGSYKILGLTGDGQIVYRKDFMNSTYNGLNPEIYSPSGNTIEHAHYNYWKLIGDELLTYGIYSEFILPTTTKYYQVLTKTNVTTGTQEYLNKIELLTNKKEIYKDIEILNNNQVFTLSDLTGMSKCSLGGYDISMSVILTGLKQSEIQKSAFKIYPNPSAGTFTLEFTGDYTSPLSISIFDITGKIVYRKELNHNSQSVIQLNMQELAAGLYSIVLGTEKEKLTQKIIVQK